MRCRTSRAERQTEKILNQVALFTARKSKRKAGVVVINNVDERRETPVVVEPAFGMRKQRADGRSSIAVIRRPVCLKAIDADFAGRV